jgi:hypothetical protein
MTGEAIAGGSAIVLVPVGITAIYQGVRWIKSEQLEITHKITCIGSAARVWGFISVFFGAVLVLFAGIAVQIDL